MDWQLLGVSLLLALIGLGVIFSSTVNTPREPLFLRHAIALGVGLIALVLAAAVPYRLLEWRAYYLYGLAVAMLVLVLVVGVEEFGARRWLVLGPVRLQPSEAAKVATLLALAHLLSSRQRDARRSGTVMRALGLAFVPAALILKQPDLGTALSFAAMAGAVLFWAGTPVSWLLYVGALCASGLLTFRLPLIGQPAGSVGGGAAGLVGFVVLALVWVFLLFFIAVVLIKNRASSRLLFVTLALHLSVGITSPYAWNQLEPYQQQRMLTFLQPESDPSGAGYQVIQSKIAIGSGGLTGKGYLRGTQKALAFLPQQHTDFAFSVLGEETGFLLSVAVLSLFLVLLLRGLHIARHARDSFASLFAAGAVGLLAYHVFLNLFMTMGLAPVTGLPMPFVSYGGSFLVVTMCLVGMLEGISLRRHSY